MDGQQVKNRFRNILAKIGAIRIGSLRQSLPQSLSIKKSIIYSVATVLVSLCTLFSTMMPFYYPLATYILVKDRRYSAFAFLGVVTATMQFGVAFGLRALVAVSFIALLPAVKKDKHSMPFCAVYSLVVLSLSGLTFTFLTNENLLRSVYFVAEGFFCVCLYPIFISGINAIENIKNKVIFTTQDIMAVTCILAMVISGLSVVEIMGANLAFLAVSYVIYVTANCFESSSTLSFAVLAGICLSLFAGFSFSFIALLCLASFCAEIFSPISKVVSVIAYTMCILLGSYLMNMNNVIPIAVLCVLAAVAFLTSFNKITDLIESYKRKSSSLPGLYKEAVGSVIKNEVNSQKSMLSVMARNLNMPSYDDESSIPRTICRILSADVCTGCVQYTRCWKNEAETTMRCFKEVVQSMMAQGESFEMPEKLAARCSKSQIMVKTISYIYDSIKIKHASKQKLIRFKKLLNLQYNHLNMVLDRLYRKLSGGVYVNTYDAELALASIQNEGVQAEKLYIIEDFDHRQRATLKSTQMLSADDMKRVVPEIISETTGKDVVFDYTMAGERIEGEYTYEYTQKFDYCLTTGFAAKNKDDNEISGDSSANTILSNGMQIVAVCDGMGSGAEASKQSGRVLDMLEELLNAGYEESSALEIINSVLVLDDADEIFAALDIFIFDLNRGLGEFIKAGAAPSFIKRVDKEKIETINFDSLPVGILDDTHIKNSMAKFSKGDFIYIMSDGYFECVGNDPKYVRQKIREFSYRNPQRIADALLSDALKNAESVASDDISVMVVKVRAS